jgi:hypothetical protein
MTFTEDEVCEIVAALQIAERQYGSAAARENAIASDHGADSHARSALRCEQRAEMTRKLAEKITAA